MTDEEKYKLLLEIDKDIAVKLRERRMSVEKTYLEATIVFAKIAINGTFILNGSAAVAVLYNAKFLGAAWIAHLCFCAGGAVCAVVCAALSYISQQYYAYSAVREAMQDINDHLVELARSLSQVEQEEQTASYEDSFWGTGNYVKNFAVLSFIASLVFFAINILILF